jgi:hypothetical protein
MQARMGRQRRTRQHKRSHGLSAPDMRLYCGSDRGGMAEWLKALAWKACIRETVSWVRIPLPPPRISNCFFTTFSLLQ